MLVLVRLLMMTMMMMMVKKTASAENNTVSVYSGETIVLPSGLQVKEAELRWDDIKWIHRSPQRRQDAMLVSLKRNMTTCEHRRCELLTDGSLNFSRVQAEDSGTYTLEVFYKNGTVRKKTDFKLRVEERQQTDSQTTHSQTTHSPQTDSQTDSMSVWICCLLLFLLLFFIIIFILRRRRIQKRNITASNEEGIYVSMHGYRGNKRKDDKKEKQEKEEESPYVPFIPAVSMETPITKQKPVEGDDVCF